MNSDLSKIFELTKSETRALFYLEDWLVRLDIASTEDDSVADRKTKWIQKWEENLFKKTFFGMIGEDPPNSEVVAIKRVQTINDPTKKLIVLCESIAFAPYFNIQFREGSHLQETIDDPNRKRWRENVIRIASKVGIEKSVLENWESHYSDALRGIGGRSDLWKKATWVALASVAFAVTGGVAAPVIGGVVGGLMGLSGAAATSAGLAFLGGGAIAAGGLGIAGGTIAIIGGGAILGGVGSLTASRFFFLQHKVVLSQLAKLEASLITIFDSQERFPSILNEIVDSQLTVLRNLNQEIESKNLELEEKKRLEKTALYYKESIKRLNDLKLKMSGLS